MWTSCTSSLLQLQSTTTNYSTSAQRRTVCAKLVLAGLQPDQIRSRKLAISSQVCVVASFTMPASTTTSPPPGRQQHETKR